MACGKGPLGVLRAQIVPVRLLLIDLRKISRKGGYEWVGEKTI